MVPSPTAIMRARAAESGNDRLRRLRQLDNVAEVEPRRGEHCGRRDRALQHRVQANGQRPGRLGAQPEPAQGMPAKRLRHSHSRDVVQLRRAAREEAPGTTPNSETTGKARGTRHDNTEKGGVSDAGRTTQGPQAIRGRTPTSWRLSGAGLLVAMCSARALSPPSPGARGACSNPAPNAAHDRVKGARRMRGTRATRGTRQAEERHLWTVALPRVQRRNVKVQRRLAGACRRRRVRGAQGWRHCGGGVGRWHGGGGTRGRDGGREGQVESERKGEGRHVVVCTGAARVADLRHARRRATRHKTRTMARLRQ